MDTVKVVRAFKTQIVKVSMYNKDGGNDMGAMKMNIAWTEHYQAPLH